MFLGRYSYADAGQMHLYLNYAREHWTKLGENPPVSQILCAEKDAAEAHYALDNLPNKVLAAEYQTVLPEEAMIVQELERTTAELDWRTRASLGLAPPPDRSRSSEGEAASPYPSSCRKAATCRA